MTASFLPKPVVGVNGSGMHTNVSVSKDGKNLMWDPAGEEKLSKFGWDFIDRILTAGDDLCLLFNASVNAYRRLDPHFEAPNQIKASAVDRGSMVRVPIGNERSARVEVRSVGPDANPYMVLLAVFKTGIEGAINPMPGLRQADRYLPDNIYDALTNFRKSDWTTTLLGADSKAALRRSQRSLGRPLCRATRHVRQIARGAVPPRSLQSVSLEFVLDSDRGSIATCRSLLLRHFFSCG